MSALKDVPACSRQSCPHPAQAPRSFEPGFLARAIVDKDEPDQVDEQPVGDADEEHDERFWRLRQCVPMKVQCEAVGDSSDDEPADDGDGAKPGELAVGGVILLRGQVLRLRHMSHRRTERRAAGVGLSTISKAYRLLRRPA